jgi:hypothetical protein
VPTAALLGRGGEWRAACTPALRSCKIPLAAGVYLQHNAMSEVTELCTLAARALAAHADHPAYARISWPGIQGIEAALQVMADRSTDVDGVLGLDRPGGVFLTAVDVMLDKPMVIRPLRSILQQSMAGMHVAKHGAMRAQANRASASSWLSMPVWQDVFVIIQVLI